MNADPPNKYPPLPPNVLHRVPEVPTDKPVDPQLAHKSLTLRDVPLDHLSKEQQDAVRKMLKPFSSIWQSHLGVVDASQHRLDTPTDARPFRSQPYRAGPADREMQSLEIKRQLALGVIEPSQSEWATPVLLVPKPDGTKRFCVDYRRPNLLTVKDSYPLPRMDDCIDSLGSAKYFTLLDANCGYWQINIRPEDRVKTAFICHEGCFEYTRMPFGLCNAPATFQRTMDIVLSGFRWKTYLVYLDDVVVFSDTFDDHLNYVSQVLNCLKTVGFSLKLSKCDFFKEEINYLGHTIRPGKLMVAKNTVEAVKNFKPPETQTHIKSFLGLCNFYRRFVPNFTRIASPFNELLKKGTPAQLPPLNEKQLEAFDKLKQALISPPTLVLPKKGATIFGRYECV